MASIINLNEVKKGETYILELHDIPLRPALKRLQMVKIASIDHFGKSCDGEPAHDCYDCVGAFGVTYRRGYNYGQTWRLWNDVPSEEEMLKCTSTSTT